MAKIVITTDSKTITVNGRTRQLGYLGFDVIDGHVNVLGAGVQASLEEVELNGNTYATDEEFLTAIQSAAFKSGGGSGTGAAWGEISGSINDQTDLVNELDSKANTVHTHTSEQITDSTETGRAVLTAESQAAARTAIGAGTSSQNLSVPSQSEVETGTETTERSINAERLRQGAIASNRRVVPVSANKTFASEDENTSQVVTAASTITFPANASVAIPVGFMARVLLVSGSATFVTASGVTAVSLNDNLSLTEAGHVATVQKIATDQWFVAINGGE